MVFAWRVQLHKCSTIVRVDKMNHDLGIPFTFCTWLQCVKFVSTFCSYADGSGMFNTRDIHIRSLIIQEFIGVVEVRSAPGIEVLVLQFTTRYSDLIDSGIARVNGQRRFPSVGKSCFPVWTNCGLTLISGHSMTSPWVSPLYRVVDSKFLTAFGFHVFSEHSFLPSPNLHRLRQVNFPQSTTTATWWMKSLLATFDQSDISAPENFFYMLDRLLSDWTDSWFMWYNLSYKDWWKTNSTAWFWQIAFGGYYSNSATSAIFYSDFNAPTADSR